MINVTIKNLPDSELEIEGEIPSEEFEKFRPAVIEEFNQEIVVDGFRKGKTPANIIEAKVGEEKILIEMAEHALSHAYPEIIKENKIDAIGRPEIQITKIAKGNPLGFKIRTAIMPEIKLADYKKIAKKLMSEKPEPTAAEEKDIDEVIEELRQNKAKHSHSGHEENADKPHTHEPASNGEAMLPEVNDEFAQSLGDFKTVADLRQKIKENIEYDKQYKAREKKRLSIMEQVITESEVKLPKVLVESEINKMEYEMKSQIEQMGLKFEDYLAHIKKEPAVLREEWRPEAEKRAKFGLILPESPKVKKLRPKKMRWKKKPTICSNITKTPTQIVSAPTPKI